MTRVPLLAGVTLVATAIATALDLVVFSSAGAIGMTGNGTADAAAAIAVFRAVEVFAVALGVALATAIAVTSLHGRPSLRALGNAVLACVLVWAVGVCAAALSPVTFFVPLALFALLFIYTPAAAIVGGCGAIGAVLASCRLAFAHAKATARVAVTAGAIGVAGAVAGALAGRWSVAAGWLVAALLQQAAAAYAGAAVAKAYRTFASDPPRAGL